MKGLKDLDREFDHFREKSSSSPRKDMSSSTTSKPWCWKFNRLEDGAEVQKDQMVSCKVDGCGSGDNLSSYKPPNLSSSTVFDPQLLAAFREAVIGHMSSIEDAKNKARSEDDEIFEDALEEPCSEEEEDGDIVHPLLEFEERCPPGGSNAVILYTTSLRGIRKTFEDCSSVRFLLESAKIMFIERDISMHLEFREELWRVMESRAIPPKLFIKGWYIGGADEVLGLHEQGMLLPLLRDVPVGSTETKICKVCGGKRFILCEKCNGSRRVFDEENSAMVRCHHCNENGLIFCPLCCRE